LLTPDAQHQALVMEIIYGAQGVKAGILNEALRASLLQVMASLAAQGAEIMLLGCTELPLLMPQDEQFMLNGQLLPVLDPSEILARKCVALALPRRASEVC
jgi:aspartate racemase